MNTDDDPYRSNEEVRLYAERFEAKRRYEIDLALQLKHQERLNESWKPLPLLVLPWWKPREKFYSWVVR